MNSGKICVSVIADSAEELALLLRRAEAVADVIEIRLDGLDHQDIQKTLKTLSSTKQILLTMRPKEQGGRSDLDLIGRIRFWTEYALCTSVNHASIWIDQEYDLVSKELASPVKQSLVIRSTHYFQDPPADLKQVYESVVSEAEVGKIAIAVEDATDAICIWRLLLRANEEGLRLIPIAMGEAGKWTRILGPGYGAFMTYAALEQGSETAPGQITAGEMENVFRVREIGRDTDVYGIIAGNTSYSVSPWMHNPAFKAAGLNAVFVPLQTFDLNRLMKSMVLPHSREIELNFKGFSVTNPHKQVIMEYLDEIDGTAARIGAVNTVKIEDGRLYGYNTDADGFILTIKKKFGDLAGSRVAVFGAGGAARACTYVLKKEKANVTVFARNKEKGRAVAEEFGASYSQLMDDHQMADDFDIAVNTTPLGTKGSNSNLTILTAPALSGLKLVYDLVYNPAETRLMQESKLAGVPSTNGMEMLIAQGAKQFEIWTGRSAPIKEMRQAVEKRLGI